jgi:hypothetical protein
LEKKTGNYMFRNKKQPKKNMSCGMAVQQVWKDLQMPWKGLTKT